MRAAETLKKNPHSGIVVTRAVVKTVTVIVLVAAIAAVIYLAR